jgi:hypothetical protein
MARGKPFQFTAHQVREPVIGKRLLIFEQSLRPGGRDLYSTSPLVFEPRRETTPGCLYRFEAFGHP